MTAPDPDDVTPAPSRGGGGGVLPRWFPRTHLVHLLYVANMGWQLAFNPESRWVEYAFAVALALAFLPLFVLSYHPDTDVRWRATRVTPLLGLLGTPFNVGASVFFVYAAAMGTSARPRRGALRWMVVQTGLLVVATLVSVVPWPYRIYGVLPSLAFIWIIGWQTIGEAARARAAERLRIENARIEALSAAAERERIARDLHDLLGHSLTGLVVRAQLVQSLLAADPDRAGAEAAQLEGTARQALAQLRAAVSGLNAVTLADELETAQRTLSAAGVAVDVRGAGQDVPDPDGRAVPRAGAAGGRHQRRPPRRGPPLRDPRGAPRRRLAPPRRRRRPREPRRGRGQRPSRHARAHHRGRRSRGARRRPQRPPARRRGRAVALRWPGRWRHPPDRHRARMTRPVRVVLAEDEQMIRDAFGQLLDLQPDVEVVAGCHDGASALEAVRHHRPDVLLTDIEMPGMSGLELAEAVAAGGLAVRVVIVTTFARPGYLRRALDAGVAGYVLKAAPVADLVQALRTVRDGGRVIEPELALMAWDAPVALTERERDVLRLAEGGLPNADIAARLHLAEGTVRNYLSDAITKLHARTRGEAAAIARSRGLL